jgi:hypothetical protein
VSNPTRLLSLVATTALYEDGHAGYDSHYLAILDCIGNDTTVMPFDVFDSSVREAVYVRDGSGQVLEGSYQSRTS